MAVTAKQRRERTCRVAGKAKLAGGTRKAVGPAPEVVPRHPASSGRSCSLSGHEPAGVQPEPVGAD